MSSIGLRGAAGNVAYIQLDGVDSIKLDLTDPDRVLFRDGPNWRPVKGGEVNSNTFTLTDHIDTTKGVRFNTSGVSTGATRILTVPNNDGTIARLENKLSAFSVTTSAELATVISDETGTGGLVFNNSPTLISPILGNALATTLTLSGQLTSTVTTGIAPFVVSSTTKVNNLNADTVDGVGIGSVTVGGVIYGLSSGLIECTPAGTVGQVLVSNGASAPVWQTMSVTGSFSSIGFEIYDALNITKRVNFNVSPVSAGNTRTLTIPDSDGTIALTNTALMLTGGTMAGNILMPSGTSSAPSLAFSSNAGTGLYSSSVGVLNVTTNHTLAATFAANGNFTAVGEVIAFSDIKLKKDLEVIDDAVEKVKQLTGYTYTRIDSGERHTGVIAQDVEKVLPEAVVDNGEFKGVAYGNLVGLLIEAIKEQQAKIEALEKKLNTKRKRSAE